MYFMLNRFAVVGNRPVHVFGAHYSIYAIMCKPLPSVGYVIVLNVKTILSAWLRINKKTIAGYMQTKLWRGDNDSATTYSIDAIRREKFHGF